MRRDVVGAGRALVDDRHGDTVLDRPRARIGGRTSRSATTPAPAGPWIVRPARKQCCTRSRGTLSPKNTTSGLSIPVPQTVQSTIRKPVTSSSCKVDVAVRVDRERRRASKTGLASRSRRVAARRGRSVFCRSPGRSTRPGCRAVRPPSVAPAAWCSPSTFCVTMPREQAGSSAARRRPGGRRSGSARAIVLPAEVAAGPVPPPGDRVAGEGLVRHRGGAALRAGRAAVVRNAGLGGQAGAGEHHDVAGAYEFGEGVEVLFGSCFQGGRAHGVNSASLLRSRVDLACFDYKDVCLVV